MFSEFLPHHYINVNQTWHKASILDEENSKLFIEGPRYNSDLANIYRRHLNIFYTGLFQPHYLYLFEGWAFFQEEIIANMLKYIYSIQLSLLCQNHWTYFDQTLCKAPFGKKDSRLFKYTVLVRSQVLCVCVCVCVRVRAREPL